MERTDQVIAARTGARRDWRSTCRCREGRSVADVYASTGLLYIGLAMRAPQR